MTFFKSFFDIEISFNLNLIIVVINNKVIKEIPKIAPDWS